MIRLRELTDLLEKERDPNKLTKLIAELSTLLDDQINPANKKLFK